MLGTLHSSFLLTSRSLNGEKTLCAREEVPCVTPKVGSVRKEGAGLAHVKEVRDSELRIC